MPPHPARPISMLLAAATLLLAVGPGNASTLPADFQESTVITGRTEPVAVRFAPNGHVYISEKSGLLWMYDDVDDTSPTQVIDLRASVHNFWDRGMLGLAIDPGYPANPYVYVLYAHDTWPPGDPRFGDPTQPRWGTGEPNPSTSDTCPTPPGPTTDGCVIYGRLSRLTIDPGNFTGVEQVLLEGNWCQQFPSHGVGDLVFGGDGYLYASAGDGASFRFADFGQTGSPINPCDDPPDGIGGPNTGTTAEGGSLRSQDPLSPGDPTSYDGSVLRIDVSSVPVSAPLDNPLVGNGIPDDDLIASVGYRNPYRLKARPGSNEIWIADVGWRTWEEIDVIFDPTGLVENHGWPCYEGQNGSNQKLADFDQQDLCQDLYNLNIPATMQRLPPYYAYNHGTEVAPGDGCGTSAGAITGIEFNVGGNYPASYVDAMFFSDYARQCIWVMYPNGTGYPDPGNVEIFLQGAPGGIVDLQSDSSGRLYYVDIHNGNVNRIEHFSGNSPPTAVITADVTNGLPPLTVNFDGGSSSDPEDGSALGYDWDLDGDGNFGDSALAAPSWIYTQPGTTVAKLRVQDSQGATDTATLAITTNNTAPVPLITAPLLGTEWEVQQVLGMVGEASDPEDGPLPPAQLSWEIILHHCTSPQDCHTHPVQTMDGVASGAFNAPDHDYPSFIEIELTARDLPPVGWFDGAWTRRVPISIDNSSQAETLIDFPVLVTLDPGRIDYASVLGNGLDLRFADAAGNALAYEIENWDSGGTSRIWVKVPSIPGGSTSETIYAYFGNPAATAGAEDPAGVWSNGYSAVLHLHDDFQDSAGSNHGTNSGTSNVAGAVGDGQYFDGASFIDLGTSPELELAGQVTLEAWFSLDNANQNDLPRILSKRATWDAVGGYNLEMRPINDNITSMGSGESWIRALNVQFDTGWHYLASAMNGSTGEIYYDGVQRTSDDTLELGTAASTDPLLIGRAGQGGYHFVGAIDEVRVSSVERSADWIAAQHLSMTDAFLGFGAEENSGVLSASTNLFLYPVTVEVGFSTIPTGLDLAVSGEVDNTPFERTLIMGSVSSVSAEENLVTTSGMFDFESWSDGGLPSHDFVAGFYSGELVAVYEKSPECSDGVDNDGDQKIDHPQDPGCRGPDDTNERRGPACGLGFEAVVLLPLVAALRRRRRAS